MITLRNLSLEALDKGKLEHYSLVRKIGEDELTLKYISKNFSSWVQEPISKEKIELGKAYVVVKEKDSIGMLGTSLLDREGKLELWYVLDPSERGKRYGDKMLGEITLYLIEQIVGLKDITLRIKKDNIASNKIAKENGYVLNYREEEDNIYYYFQEPMKSVEKKH